MGNTGTAAFRRTPNDINHNEVAGAFSRVFEGVFLKASTEVLPDCVSMSMGGVEVTVHLDGDEWVGRIVLAGKGEVEDFAYEGFESFDEVVNWLCIARHLWDSELRPVAPDWHDVGGIPTSRGGDFSVVAEQWAYRTACIVLSVYYDDPEGWCVGFGYNPREAASKRIHGPFKDMNHAKLYAEAWVTLDDKWCFAGKGAFGDWSPTDLWSMSGGRCRRVEGGWENRLGEICESPLDALLMIEQTLRDRKAATKIGDPDLDGPAVAF